MKKFAAVLSVMIVACTSPSRRPAAASDSPQELKIKEIAEQVKTAGVPDFHSFQSLDMKFNFDQSWRLVSLGADKPGYTGPQFIQYELGSQQIFDGSLHTTAFRQLTDKSEFSDADFRHILHGNGICLRGTWHMDSYVGPAYTGQFQPGTNAKVIVRASPFGTNVMVNTQHYNSFGFVGRVFLADQAQSADFITQTDLGGVEARSFFQSDTLNAPPVSPLNRKQTPFDFEVTKFITTGAVFSSVDSNNSNRQVYAVAELGKENGATRAPPFIKFAFSKMQVPPPSEAMDFRNEILAHMPFSVEVQASDGPPVTSLLFGKKVPVDSPTWRRIGQVDFDAAVVSHACDFRLNMRHSPWRDDLNTPGTERPSLHGH